MNHNMQPYSRMPLGAMSMGLGGPPNVSSSEAINHPRPPLAVGGNAKKKRRTNPKGPRMQSLPCPITQDLNLPVENPSVFARPPQLSGYGDTVIANNPFDDMPSRASQMALMHSVPRHVHPQHQQQHITGPRMMRGTGPTSSMGELSSMMGHNSMGPMNPTGNPMNLMGRISPINLASNQQPGAMGLMHNPINRMSPMNNMGQSQHLPMNMMGNSINCENPMSNMGQNQSMNALNNHASPMSNMGSNHPTPMNMINHPMGRMSPIKNTGRSEAQVSINDINSCHMGMSPQVRGTQMSSMERGIISPINGMSGGNQNHIENGPINMGAMSNCVQNQSVNGPLSMNSASGLFGCNPSHSHSHHMGIHMNAGNLGRSINDPVNAMNQMTHSNINVSGPNGMNHTNMGGHPINIMSNDMNVAQRNQIAMQMGGPNFGSMPGNMFSTMQSRHPINMGSGSITHHEFQTRPAIGPKTVAPSNGKVYPPDQHIIFNSQNRNAPPIYLCGSCHKEVNDNDQGIVCESGCNFWFHRNCVGLSEAAFHMLTQAPYAEWVCDNCTKGKNVAPIRFTT